MKSWDSYSVHSQHLMVLRTRALQTSQATHLVALNLSFQFLRHLIGLDSGFEIQQTAEIKRLRIESRSQGRTKLSREFFGQLKFQKASQRGTKNLVPRFQAKSDRLL